MPAFEVEPASTVAKVEGGRGTQEIRVEAEGHGHGVVAEVVPRVSGGDIGAAGRDKRGHGAIVQQFERETELFGRSGGGEVSSD